MRVWQIFRKQSKIVLTSTSPQNWSARRTDPIGWFKSLVTEGHGSRPELALDDLRENFRQTDWEDSY